jgi:hypothetical protein
MSSATARSRSFSLQHSRCNLDDWDDPEAPGARRAARSRSGREGRGLRQRDPRPLPRPYDMSRAADTPSEPGPTGMPPWLDSTVRLARLPVVSIAVIRGVALSVANEFALACDLRFASVERASFQQLGVHVGFGRGGGAVPRLPCSSSERGRSRSSSARSHSTARPPSGTDSSTARCPMVTSTRSSARSRPTSTAPDTTPHPRQGARERRDAPARRVWSRPIPFGRARACVRPGMTRDRSFPTHVCRCGDMSDAPGRSTTTPE